MPFVSALRTAQSRAIAPRFFQTYGCRAFERAALRQLQTRRHYGRILKTIVSKHITSISDVIRPILPTGLNSIPNKRTRTITQVKQRETEYVPQPTPEKDAEVPEDDISTEPYSPAVIDTDTQTQVRTLMRLVPHPVAIITSTHPNFRAGSAFRGMTVSSFNTVTLYPEPVVSFNVKIPSETYDAIRSSQRFLVHLLASNAATANLAREFSRGHENVLLEDKKHTFRFISPTAPEQPVAPAQGEPPRLLIENGRTESVGSSVAAQDEVTPDFPFILECKYHPSSAHVGDHVIVLGTVVKVHSDKPRNESRQNRTGTALSTNDLCLTYADTRFWKMGEHITPLPRTNNDRS